VVKIRRALISVSDKTGIVELCTILQNEYQIELLSTGGTAAALRNAGLTVQDVSDYTAAPECLDGRVKTLHPKIHGGLLQVRNNPTHESEAQALNIPPIDLTIVNLYPFSQTVQKYYEPDGAEKDGDRYHDCIENIDIGGPSMIRSTAKNHLYTTILTDPSQYESFCAQLKQTGGGTTWAYRKTCAYTAFSTTAQYDSNIATFFMNRLEAETRAPVVKVYQPEFSLKYGCNPHQLPAQILSRQGCSLPFTVVNGTPGYINLLDAANAYQLVMELKQATSLAAAASFKHVSPAGGTLNWSRSRHSMAMTFAHFYRPTCISH
jgi:phosphoribosylaminoimidazolecarboxamide formyltransferase / IMP cyclohydrolase